MRTTRPTGQAVGLDGLGVVDLGQPASALAGHEVEPLEPGPGARDGLGGGPAADPECPGPYPRVENRRMAFATCQHQQREEEVECDPVRRPYRSR
jgi:hypothetical protein